MWKLHVEVLSSNMLATTSVPRKDIDGESSTPTSPRLSCFFMAEADGRICGGKHFAVLLCKGIFC